MAIVIPRVCEGCGKDFVRRGRAKYCEECRPPGTTTPSKNTPKDQGKRTDIANTSEFFRDAFAAIAVSTMPFSKHDAAVMFNAARTVPPHLARVMEQDANTAEKLAAVARRGAFVTLAFVLGATVIAPIAANHLPIVPDKLKMSDEAVDQITSTMMETLASMMTETVTVEPPKEPTSNDAPDLDLSFLESSSDAA